MVLFVKTKDYQCQECKRMLTAKQAARAVNSDKGCPGCGGTDIDLAVGKAERRSR